jgi:hypothetical protein
MTLRNIAGLDALLPLFGLPEPASVALQHSLKGCRRLQVRPTAQSSHAI